MLFVHDSIIKKVKNFGPKDKKVIKTWSRNSVILPDFLGITFLVHNGSKFIPVEINDERKIGKKLGEFAPTKKSHQWGKKNK